MIDSVHLVEVIKELDLKNIKFIQNYFILFQKIYLQYINITTYCNAITITVLSLNLWNVFKI